MNIIVDAEGKILMFSQESKPVPPAGAALIELTPEQTAEFKAAQQAQNAGLYFVDGVFNSRAAPDPTALEKIAVLERTEGQGVYVRGVREFMLGMAQIIAAQGGPDIVQTPGMQNVKRLDDKIKVLRSQI